MPKGIYIRIKKVGGWKLSEETKKKIGKATQKRPGGMLGKKHTKEWREKRSEQLKGKNNPHWKGGITPENRKIRTSIEMKEWRKAVFERDDFRCRDCGIRGNQAGGYLEADHIYSFAKYPRLHFVLENGQTLCKSCHIQKTIFEKTGRIELNNPMSF